jgi:hypothetical protein
MEFHGDEVEVFRWRRSAGTSGGKLETEVDNVLTDSFDMVAFDLEGLEVRKRVAGGRIDGDVVQGKGAGLV